MRGTFVNKSSGLRRWDRQECLSYPKISFTLSNREESRCAGRFSTGKSRAKLFEQAPLLARQFGGRHDVNVHVQIALAAAVRIGQALALSGG